MFLLIIFMCAMTNSENAIETGRGLYVYFKSNLLKFKLLLAHYFSFCGWLALRHSHNFLLCSPHFFTNRQKLYNWTTTFHIQPCLMTKIKQDKPLYIMTRINIVCPCPSPKKPQISRYLKMCGSGMKKLIR